MADNEEKKPTYRRPEEPEATLVDEQAAYFAYWNAQRIERLRREREEEDSSSVYERAWRRPQRRY